MLTFNLKKQWFDKIKSGKKTHEYREMTEEIINTDGSRNWEANILLDNIKRLEQENKVLKEEIRFHNKENSNLLAERNAAQIGYDEIREVRERYRSALEEIRKIVNEPCIEDEDCETCDSDCICKEILDKINEVLQCE